MWLGFLSRIYWSLLDHDLMVSTWEKAISILAGNLNKGRSYLITAVIFEGKMYVSIRNMVRIIAGSVNQNKCRSHSVNYISFEKLFDMTEVSYYNRQTMRKLSISTFTNFHENFICFAISCTYLKTNAKIMSYSKCWNWQQILKLQQHFGFLGALTQKR